MRYYLVAGEASGDLHGSNLARAIEELDVAAKLRGWGGDQMQTAGVDVQKHIRELAFMGFVEVAANLSTILGNFRTIQQDILAFRPDVLILIDYPGFNLRLAKWAHRQGLRVVYYISPQLWAWHSSRAKQIRRFVDQLIVILPFEQAFFAQYDIEANYVGHPLLDVIDGYQPDSSVLKAFTDKPVIVLLPGSRKQEISNILPTMLEVVPQFPGYQFVIAGAPALEANLYAAFLSDSPAPQTPVVSGHTYDLLAQSHAAIVTSGTATLEAALFELPQMVVYRGSPLSYWIARQLVQVEYISLVNLILDKPLLTELIQQDYTVGKVAQQLQQILDPTHRQTLQTGYRQLRNILGGGGASSLAAKTIVEGLT